MSGTSIKLGYENVSMNTVSMNTGGRDFISSKNSLLENQDFINTMAHFICNKKSEYSVIDDKRVAWDLLKFDIQNLSIETGIKLAREKRLLEQTLLKKCDTLYSTMCHSGLSEQDMQEYLTCKRSLEDINEYK